jgi:hypothetical protein
MSAPKRRHGYKGSVKMDPAPPAQPAPPVPVVVADLNSWSLDASRDRADATCFQDLNKIWLQGLPNYEGDLGGIWSSDGSPVLFDAALGDIAVALELIPSTLDAVVMFKGLAYLDASIEVPADGSINVTGSWVAAGNWTFVKALTLLREGEERPAERPA